MVLRCTSVPEPQRTRRKEGTRLSSSSSKAATSPASVASYAFTWQLAATVVLAVVIPGLLIGVHLRVAPPEMYLARYLVVVYSAVRLGRVFADTNPRWFATTFWSFCYVWLGLAALAQDDAGHSPYGLSIASSLEFKSAIVVLVGMAGWDLAYLVARRSGTRRISEGAVKSLLLAPVLPRRVAALSILALLVTPILLMRQGGLLVFWLTRSEKTEALVQNGLYTADTKALGGIVGAVTLVLPFVALLGFIHVMTNYPELRRRPGWWAVGAINLALNLLVSSPIGNSRYWFGTVVLGILLSLPFARRLDARRWIVTGIIVGFVFVFPYADYFRRPDETLVRRDPVFLLTNKLDYDAASQLTNAIQIHDAGLGTGGRQLLGAVGFFVPRPLWPGKPTATGTYIAQAEHFNFTHMSAPLWAEGYIDFGLLGTLAVLAIAGTVSGRADSRYIESSGHFQHAGLVQLLTPPAAAYMMIVLRGSLIATIGSGTLLVVVCVALVVGSRRKLIVADAQHGG